MKKIYFLLLVCCSFGLQAQPGLREVVKNLNDYSPEEIRQSEYSDGSTFYTYIIDSNTDVSKIRGLRILKSVRMVLRVKSLPKEFSFLSDSLKYIDIDASGKLADISALKQFKNLASIKINNYAGTDLPALSELTSLSYLYLQGNQVKDISNLMLCKQLVDLTIISQSLPAFFLCFLMLTGSNTYR